MFIYKCLFLSTEWRSTNIVPFFLHKRGDEYLQEKAVFIFRTVVQVLVLKQFGPCGLSSLQTLSVEWKAVCLHMVDFYPCVFVSSPEIRKAKDWFQIFHSQLALTCLFFPPLTSLGFRCLIWIIPVLLHIMTKQAFNINTWAQKIKIKKLFHLT